MIVYRVNKGEHVKRKISVFLAVLLLCTAFSPVCQAEGADSDTLSEWNIKISVPEGATAVLDESEYYIYAQEEGSIPYVMLRTYPYDDPVALLDDFTAYMQQQYPDLKVTADIARRTFGDKKCFEIDYSYHVSGYEVRDRRLAMIVNGSAYLFASKEIEELGMTIGTMLEDIVAGCTILSPEDAERSTGLAAAYLYSLEDGMPKYWLDFTGTVADNLVLHCWFRSGEPTFYERCYVLDLSTAETSGNGLKILQIHDSSGNDCSHWLSIIQKRPGAGIVPGRRSRI